MALVLQVGAVWDIFIESFASQVCVEIEKQVGFVLPANHDFDHYCSEELGWSGWAQLQSRVASVLGRNQIPHFLAVDAWQGVYLPVELEPTVLSINPSSSPLQCAGLYQLSTELHLFAKSENLPVDEVGLEQLWEKYAEDDDLVEEEMEMQTYAQLMLALRVAIQNQFPLWVVK